MKEEFIKNVQEAILKELQIVITLAYIIAVAIGMLFTYQKHIVFGINIFDYADVFDFLIAPFSDAKIVMFTFGSLALVFTLLRLDSIYKKKSPKSYSIMNFALDKKTWFNGVRYFLFAIGFIVYLYQFSIIYAEVSERQIKNQTVISIRYSDNEIEKGILIGKTKEVIFLLKKDKVTVIPIINGVKEFDVK